MSIIPKESIEVIAQSIGINDLSSDVTEALAPDVEYRIREIMQEAIKCMRHSRRTFLMVDDVDTAINLRNLEPVYGFASRDPLRFKRAVGHQDLFYFDDKDIDFKDVIEAPLPKPPLDTSVTVHWLAIEGVQPAIPENASLALVSPSEDVKPEATDGRPVDIKLPMKHVLSQELQLYFDKVIDLVVGKSDTEVFKKALMSLATDSGIHPLVPYFTFFIADEVTRNLSNIPFMISLMRVVRSLLQNEHIHIELYLHQLMPSVITCVVARRLGKRSADNHWELRSFGANLVAMICKRYGSTYQNLQHRVTKTLVNAFLDPTKSLPQHFGAIQCLAALGSTVVRLLILPNLEAYMKHLELDLSYDEQRGGWKRHEASRVYGTLLHAAGHCLYERLKLIRDILLSSVHPSLQTGARLASKKQGKRCASEKGSSLQPLLKKVATDGPITPSVAGDRQPIQSEDNSFVFGDHNSSSHRNLPVSAANECEIKATEVRSAIFTEAWKEDLQFAHLLSSLFETFGEDILPYVPLPEMSLFM